MGPFRTEAEASDVGPRGRSRRWRSQSHDRIARGAFTLPGAENPALAVDPALSQCRALIVDHGWHQSAMTRFWRRGERVSLWPSSRSYPCASSECTSSRLGHPRRTSYELPIRSGRKRGQHR